MSIWCRLGFHRWRAFGGETLRDGRNKLHVQWQICLRAHCPAMRPRNRAEFSARTSM